MSTQKSKAATPVLKLDAFSACHSPIDWEVYTAYTGIFTAFHTGRRLLQ